LGYNLETKTWAISDYEDIELNLIGPDNTISLTPRFKVLEVSVAPYSTMGVEFEAIIGITNWQDYVIGFSFVDFQRGGPDGTISMLQWKDIDYALNEDIAKLTPDYIPLEGLNTIADERFPSVDETGNVVTFQSNRSSGKGGWDVYVWKNDEGIRNLPDLNRPPDDSDPCISPDGRYVVFHSNRSGNYDIYMYDLTQQSYIDLSFLNTDDLERNPVINRYGRYIVFRSERPGGTGNSDIFIYMYDRQQYSYIDLPGLYSVDNEFDPSINLDGSRITFHSTRTGTVGGKDVYVYDVINKKMITTTSGLSGVNTVYADQSPSISTDGKYLALQSNRRNPQMKMYDRDIFIIHNLSGLVLTTTGLNTPLKGGNLSC